MSAPLTRPRTAPVPIATTRHHHTGRAWSRISLAVMTEHTMIAPPTDTAMPPVRITNVLPMPINATGATSTSSGMIEPALRNAGVENASATQSTTCTTTGAISAGGTGDGGPLPRVATGAADGVACGSTAVLMRDLPPPQP